MDRRTFLKGIGVMGTGIMGGSHISRLNRLSQRLAAPRDVAASAGPPPNILVIMVDQLRAPQWFPSQTALDSLLPNMARLRAGAVTFDHFYAAATACSPSRSAMLTGLYTHQTGCLLTIVPAQNPAPSLDPGFPTWGTLLRTLGYQTFWYGKWHLATSCNLDQYGFSGGTCPSPDGAPGQGLAVDPGIADQFSAWLPAQGTAQPWCTTVSFVNPHDIAWYYKQSSLVAGENNPPSRFTALPPNFETPTGLQNRNKPRLQVAFEEMEAGQFGTMPYSGLGFQKRWLKFMDLYLQLQQYVDTQIGRVLDTLAQNPGVAANTIILFTADHGEYGGSHGLRGKGSAVYEEGIRVPLYVNDPTGRWTVSPGVARTQLVSSVDLTPLLLTLARGDTSWQALPQCAHLAQRLDISAILRDPQAPGRPYIVTTTDEDFVEFANITGYAAGAPRHLIGYRTAGAKLGTYNDWATGTLDITAAGQESECYDYSMLHGIREVNNVAASNPALYSQLYSALVNDAIPNELRRPLPAALLPVQQASFNAYLACEARL